MKGSDFTGIAKLIKESRLKTTLSQSDLSRELNLRNGQFISNIERGLCGIPPKYGLQVCKLLSIDPNTMIEVISADHRSSLLKSFNINLEVNNEINQHPIT